MQEQKSFNEVEYFTDIAKIRYVIARLMEKYQLLDQVQPLNIFFNQFSLRTDKNPQATFGLEFDEYQLPEYLYTPYGKLEINSNDRFRNLNAVMVPPEGKEQFFQELKNVFRLQIIQPHISDEYNDKMLQPAIYGITKLPWKEKIFNQLYQIVPTDADLEGKIDPVERKHLIQILAQVNNKLRKIGHPECCYMYQASALAKNITLPEYER